jgi:hypothetical protein
MAAAHDSSARVFTADSQEAALCDALDRRIHPCQLGGNYRHTVGRDAGAVHDSLAGLWRSPDSSRDRGSLSPMRTGFFRENADALLLRPLQSPLRELRPDAVVGQRFAHLEGVLSPILAQQFEFDQSSFPQAALPRCFHTNPCHYAERNPGPEAQARNLSFYKPKGYVTQGRLQIGSRLSWGRCGSASGLSWLRPKVI